VKTLLIAAIAVIVAVPLAASAGELTGTVKSVSPAEKAFVLADGTQLWADDRQIMELQEGVKVRATFEERDGKKIVTEIDRRVVVDGVETSNFGSKSYAP
jgi:hypothetical protein